jgi:hypothetical protein
MLSRYLCFAASFYIDPVMGGGTVVCASGAGGIETNYTTLASAQSQCTAKSTLPLCTGVFYNSSVVNVYIPR